MQNENEKKISNASFSVPVAKDDVSAEQKKKKLQKKPKEARIPMPVRSLTDKEYEEIFDAVLKRVEKEAEELEIETGKKMKEEPDNKLEQSSDEEIIEKVKEEPETDVESDNKSEHSSDNASGDEAIMGNMKEEPDMEVESDNKSEHSSDNTPEDEIENNIDNWERNDQDCEERDITQNTETHVNEKEPLKKVNNQRPFRSPISVPVHKKLVSKVTCRGQKQKHKSDSHQVQKENVNDEKKTNIFQKVKKSCTESVRKESPQPKSASLRRVSLQEMMKEREIEDVGTWVLCGNPVCQKWRYLADVADPLTLPNKWQCSMNLDEQYNSCDKPEEEYNEEEHIFTKYTEGSIVWARMDGYPWWPGMIEIDPDYGTYFEVETLSMYPTQYHVVFFDDKVSRAWTRLSGLLPYSENPNDQFSSKVGKFKKEINAAKKNAKAALDYSIKERLRRFGFAARFKGKWGYTFEDHKEEQPKRVRQKRSRHTKRDIVNDDLNLLDETTMEEIINNTESVLSSMEDMIDNLKEESSDSDDDSEYEPKCTNSAAREWLEKRREARKRRMKTEVPDENLDNKVVRTTTNSAGQLCMQLDPNIFTMDMSDDTSDRNNNFTVTGNDLFEKRSVPNSTENDKPEKEKKKNKKTKIKKDDGILEMKIEKEAVQENSNINTNPTENSMTIEELEPKKKKTKKNSKKPEINCENKSTDKSETKKLSKIEAKKNAKEKKIPNSAENSITVEELEPKRKKFKKSDKKSEVNSENKTIDESETNAKLKIEGKKNLKENKNKGNIGDSKCMQSDTSETSVPKSSEKKLHKKKPKNGEGNSKPKLTKMSVEKKIKDEPKLKPLVPNIGTCKKKVPKFIAPVTKKTQDIPKKNKSEINTDEGKKHFSKTTNDSEIIGNDLSLNVQDKSTNRSNKDKQCISQKEKNEGSSGSSLKEKNNKLKEKKATVFKTDKHAICIKDNGEEKCENFEKGKGEMNVTNPKRKKINILSLKKDDSIGDKVRKTDCSEENYKKKNPKSGNFNNPKTDKNKNNVHEKNNDKNKSITQKLHNEQLRPQNEESDDEILTLNDNKDKQKVNTPVRSTKQHSSQSQETPLRSRKQHSYQRQETPVRSRKQHRSHSQVTPVRSRKQHSSQTQETPVRSRKQHSSQRQGTPLRSGKLRSSQSQETPERSRKQHSSQRQGTPLRSGKLRSSQSQETPERSRKLHRSHSQETPVRSRKQHSSQRQGTPLRSGKLRSSQSQETPERSRKQHSSQRQGTPVISGKLRCSQSQEKPERSRKLHRSHSQETPLRSKKLRSSQSEDSDDEMLNINNNKVKKVNTPERSRKLHSSQSRETPVRSRKLCSSQSEDSDDEMLNIYNNKGKKVNTPERSRKLHSSQTQETPVRSRKQHSSQSEENTPVRSRKLRNSQKEENTPVRSKELQSSQSQENTPVRSRKLRNSQKQEYTPVRSKKLLGSQNQENTPVRSKELRSSQSQENTPVRSRKLRNSQKEENIPLRSKELQSSQSQENTQVRSKKLHSSQNQDSDDEFLDIDVNDNRDKQKPNTPIRARKLRSSQKQDSGDEMLDINDDKNKKVSTPARKAITPVRSRKLHSSQNDQQCPDSDSLDLDLDIELSPKSVKNKPQLVNTEDSDPFELGEE